MGTVSIVMATYNGSKYVEEQVKSILGSTYNNFDLFIYDDGSKDDTVRILTECAKDNQDRVHFYQNEKNLGFIKNFLNGICRTTSNYVMLCDQDDIWKPDKIEVTLKRMKQMEATHGSEVPIAVFTDTTVIDNELKVLNQSFYKTGHLDTKKVDLSHQLMENKLIGCTVMINASLRKILQSKGLPEQARYHDWWIGLIAASMGRISYIDKATMLYRQHGNNVVGNMSFTSYIKNRILSISKQRETILASMKQASEFYELYKEFLNPESKEIIKRFLNLSSMNFIQRRICLLRYGYLKTGFIRNIGLILII